MPIIHSSATWQGSFVTACISRWASSPLVTSAPSFAPWTRSGAPMPGWLARLHRRSGGNPFFLRELVRLLEVEGGPDGTDPMASRSVPASIRAVVARRVRRLTPATATLLEAGAVAGTELEVPLLVAVTGRSADDVLAGIDEAEAAGLVVGTSIGGVFGFAHALVREVIYDGLARHTRRQLHSRLAEVVEQHHDETRLPELAHHLLESAMAGGDERVVEACRRAAEWSFGRLGYEGAAGWYGRALAVLARSDHGDDSEKHDELEGELLLRQGEAHLAAGDVPGSRTAFERAVALARRRGRSEELAMAALGLGAGLGGFEVGLQDQRQIEVLEEALAALGPEPSRLRAWVLARLSVALPFVDAGARRRVLSDQAVVMAGHVGDEAALGYALATRCDVLAGPEHCETRLADATEAVRLARGAGDHPLELLGRRLRLVALLEVGDVDAADVEIDRFASVAEAMRQPLYRWYVPLWRGMRALMRGDPTPSLT